MRPWLVVLLLMSVVFLPSASAHGDARGIDWSGSLAPGESVRFERDFHWHRVVGRVAAGEDARLTLTIIGPSRETAVSVKGEARINELIRCCMNETWATHTIQLTNDGAAPAAARMDLAFVHDDFAVLADGAEGGTGTSILLFGTLVGAAAWLSLPTGPPDEAKARKWRRVSAISIGSAWGLMLVLALIGMVRYGGGPLQGSLTAFALAPLPGPAVNSHVLGMAVLVALWVTALFAWSAARRWAPAADRWEQALAVATLVGAPLFLVFATLEYGFAPVFTRYGLVPVVVFGVVRWWRRSRAAVAA